MPTINIIPICSTCSTKTLSGSIALHARLLTPEISELPDELELLTTDSEAEARYAAAGLSCAVSNLFDL